MTEKDFIIGSINNLVKIFPNTRVRYENHTLSNTHFIEVIPNKVYRLNKEFQKWEENVVFEFIAKFPDQNICFISDDAIVGIENIEYEAKGDFYDLLFSVNPECYQVVEVTSIHTEFHGKPFAEIKFGQPSVVYSDVTDLFYNISKKPVFSYKGIVTCTASIDQDIQNISLPKYAMAA